jgi:outer membrane lipopolysaccharide assembly protein LptE/RlpB
MGNLMRKHRIGLILTVSVMMVSACGYRFAGEGNFPGGASRLFVAVLENQTIETGFEAVMTNDLIYEITRSRANAYTSNPLAADAVLTGTIRETRTVTVSRQSTQVSLRRRVTAYVDLHLTDRQGKVVWKVRRLSAKQEYDVVDSQAVTEQNRKDALRSLSSKFAEKVVIRLTEEF